MRTTPQLTTIEISVTQHLAQLRLNRPERSNALDATMWQEFRTALAWADAATEVRVVVISGAGRNFCSGIDLAMLAGVEERVAHRDPARRHEALRRLILDLQDCLAAIERCRKPVLAAIHGACIGGGIDLVRLQRRTHSQGLQGVAQPVHRALHFLLGSGAARAGGARGVHEALPGNGECFHGHSVQTGIAFGRRQASGWPPQHSSVR